MQGITEWVRSWKARGWKTAAKEPVKNEDLWRRLDEARDRHDVDWRWVKATPATSSTNGPTSLPARQCWKRWAKSRGPLTHSPLNDRIVRY